ncbi:MAG: hypothetical protein WAV13_05155 [Thermodesulfovibrionales bacterium]
MMVAVCTVVPLAVALVGVPIVNITVSLGSSGVSPVIVIVADPVVEPALIVIGLAVTVRSPAADVPVTVKGTVTSSAEAADSWAVTAMVPVSFTLAWLAAVHCTVGAESSSVIVTVALLSAPSVAPPVGVESVTVKVSFVSSIVSCVIGTVKVLFAISPSAHDSVPEVVV